MTQEQKARAYDEALKRARKILDEILDNEILGFPDQIREIFPQLKESEDERIRKAIIKSIEEDSSVYEQEVSKEQMIAYLEKQKENQYFAGYTKGYSEGQKNPHQEPTKEELYAEEGTTEEEYIANTMKKVRELREKQKEQKFIHHEVDESLAEAVTHQMEDDGDVDDFVRKGLDDVVLKYAKLGAKWQKEQKPSTPKYRVGDVMRTKEEATEGITDGLPVIVSVDDGYYYCTNEKIPISEQEEYEFPPINMRQKQEWSEEDEKMCCNILNALTPNIVYTTGSGTRTGTSTYKYDKEINWLKVLPLKLKKENEDVAKLCSNDWTEEDKKMLEKLLSIIEPSNGYAEIRDWLLPKFKSLRPQYHGDVTMTEAYKMGLEAGNALSWKPSEEQMGALQAVINDPNNANSLTCQLELQDLLNCLEKLM